MQNGWDKCTVFRFESWSNSARYEPLEKKNYECDITYATNSELGFDYLRDNMSTDIEEVVQRKFNYCVIGEVDSILIDEARTPLIISGQIERPQEKYQTAAELSLSLFKAKELSKDGVDPEGDYEVMKSNEVVYLQIRVRKM